MDRIIGTSQTSIVLASNASGAAQNYYFTCFVSKQLLGITSISAQTWTYNIATAQSNTQARFPIVSTGKSLRITAYVWRPGTGKVGNILDGNSAATVGDSPGTTNERCRTATFSGSAVASIQDNDVIIFEIWFPVTQGTATSYNDTLYYDGTTVTATDYTAVTDHASFIETPQDLAFVGELTRISLSRIYKYNLVNTISKARIYKYNLQARLSLARIYSYKLQARLSLARIYRYAVIQRLQLARIYQYNIIKRLSLSRIYPYKILARISRARIFKYQLLFKISLARLYQYKISQRLSFSRLYKYNIFQSISLTRIYKYSLLTKLSLLRIYRYKLSQRLQLARVYNYNIFTRINLNLIYRYAVIQRLLLSRIYQYKIIGRLKLTRIYRYAIFKRLSLARIYPYKIIGRILKPQIYKYQLFFKISLARLYRYRLLNKVSLARIYRYKLFAHLILSRIYKYNLLTPISLARIYRYKIAARISLIQIYKYGIISALLRAAKSSIYRYKMTGRLVAGHIYNYNILQKVGNSNTILFDGVNDYVNCGNDASLWSGTLSKFSFSIWIYPTAIPGSALIVDHNSNNAQSFVLYNSTIGTAVTFRIVKNDLTPINCTASSLPNMIGRWVHIVCTYDNSLGSANLKIYVDGIRTGNQPNLTETLTTATVLTLAGAVSDHTGNMKDFRWFNTKALTAAEVTDIFNNAPTAPTPDYWLKMNEGTGSLIDSITGTKIATLTNGASWASGNAPAVWLGAKQTYNYNLLQKIGTKTNLYIYKILNKISVTRIYQYNILEKLFLSKIYKYGILNRLLSSVIYRYRLLTIISLTRIYKYQLINFVRLSAARTYRYGILQKVTKPRTYLYRILKKISLPRTYSYQLSSRLSTQNLYRYSLLKKILAPLARTYLYKLLGRLRLAQIYRYAITIPTTWTLAGKTSDFPTPLSNLVITYIVNNWTASDPPMSGTVLLTSTNPNENQVKNVNIGSYDYDKFRTYYIRVKEQPARIVNKARWNLMEFNSIIEMKISVRRLTRGQAFPQLQNILNELIRIWLTFENDDVFGIQAISFETITPLQNKETITMNQSNKTVWEKTLKIVLHYQKVYRGGIIEHEQQPPLAPEEPTP